MKVTCLFFFILFIGCTNVKPIYKSVNKPNYIQVTKHELSLEYLFEKNDEGFKLRIYSKDPIMVTRIALLGLKVSFDQRAIDLPNITYPIGILEVRRFISFNELYKFWEETNNDYTRRARVKRLKSIAKVGSGRNQTFTQIDSLRPKLQASFVISNQEFYYDMTVVNSNLDLKKKDIIVTIGQLYFSPKILSRGANGHPLAYLYSQGYLEYFQSIWATSISD